MFAPLGAGLVCCLPTACRVPIFRFRLVESLLPLKVNAPALAPLFALSLTCKTCQPKSKPTLSSILKRQPRAERNIPNARITPTIEGERTRSSATSRNAADTQDAPTGGCEVKIVGAVTRCGTDGSDYFGPRCSCIEFGRISCSRKTVCELTQQAIPRRY